MESKQVVFAFWHGSQGRGALTGSGTRGTIRSMRVLLSRTDALGDLVISLPAMARILSRDPQAEIHWLVRPYTAPLLEHLPGIAGIHLRQDGQDLVGLLRTLRPDAVLNLGHRDGAVTVAAREAGIPIRVARARGLDQTLAATHRLWKGRHGTGRHEAQNVLDFLAPLGWGGGSPPLQPLHLTPAERLAGETDLSTQPGAGPRLGVILRGSGAGAVPSQAWWDRTLPLLREAGWNPIRLAPPDTSDIPASDLRRLMARLAACHVVIGPSTGPVHIAAALGTPVLCLMGLRSNHGPDRWAPLGPLVQVLQYPGPEADLAHGMDRLDPKALLPHLARLR